MSILFYPEDLELVKKDKNRLLELKQDIWSISFPHSSIPENNEIDEQIRKNSKKIDCSDKEVFVIFLDIIIYCTEIRKKFMKNYLIKVI